MTIKKEDLVRATNTDGLVSPPGVPLSEADRRKLIQHLAKGYTGRPFDLTSHAIKSNSNVPLTEADRQSIALKYSEEQPRDSHGRWTSGGDTGEKESIIIVSDNEANLNRIGQQIEDRYGTHYNVITANSASAAKRLADDKKVAMVLADARLTTSSGVALLATVHDNNPTAQRILLRDNADVEQRKEAATASLAGTIDAQVPSGSNPESSLYPATSNQLGVRSRILDSESHEEQDKALGIKALPSKNEYEVAIVGAGPGGLTAAIHAGFEGLDTVVLSGGYHGFGGQAGQTSMIRNYSSYPNGVTGQDLTHDMLEQSVNTGSEVTGSKATGLRAEGDHYVLTFEGDKPEDRVEVKVEQVVLANGADFRRLPAPGLDELVGRGVTYGPPTSKDAARLGGQEVYMVGGGNSVAQAALNVAKFTDVNVLIRGSQLGEMSTAMVNQVESNPRIHVHYNTEVAAGHGSDDKSPRLTSLTLKNNSTKVERPADADQLYVMIGTGPRTEWLKGSGIELNKSGHILAGRDLAESGRWKGERPPRSFETSLPGVFAIGDVKSNPASRVQGVTGEGAAAIKDILNLRLAKEREKAGKKNFEDFSLKFFNKFARKYSEDQPRDSHGRFSTGNDSPIKVEANVRDKALNAILEWAGNPDVFHIDGPFFARFYNDKDAVSFELKPGSDGIRLSSIRVPPENRGKGLASKALKELTDLADKHQVAITGTVSPEKGGLTKTQLFAWYERNGFERLPFYDGSNKKSDNIRREPKKSVKYSEAQPRDDHGRWSDAPTIGSMSDSGSPLPFVDDTELPVFFHGTSSNAIKNILDEGLDPTKGQGADASLKLDGEDYLMSRVESGDRKFSVFLTDDINTAKEFGQRAAMVAGGEAAILEVEIPPEFADRIRRDEEYAPGSAGSFRIYGKIPPDWLHEIEAGYEWEKQKPVPLKYYIVALCNTKPGKKEKKARRELTATEKLINLKAISDAFDQGESDLVQELEKLRKQMLKDAIDGIIKLSPAEYHTLNLEIPATATIKLKEELLRIYSQGRELVRDELNAQAEDAGELGDEFIDEFRDNDEFDDELNEDDEGELDDVASVTVSRVANDVQARVIGAAAGLAILGLIGAELADRLTEDLADSSTGYLSGAAAGASHAALSVGRESAASDLGNNIAEVYYSSVLDENTCSNCEAADGETGASDEEISDAPNPDCDGGVRCRCIHVYMLTSEQKSSRKFNENHDAQGRFTSGAGDSIDDIHRELVAHIDGNEHAILTDAKGEILGRADGDARSVETIQAPGLFDLGTNLEAHHTHPLEVPPSAGDLLYMANHPGIGTLYVHSEALIHRVQPIWEGHTEHEMYFGIQKAYDLAHSKILDNELATNSNLSNFGTSLDTRTETEKDADEQQFFNSIHQLALTNLQKDGFIKYEKFPAKELKDLIAVGDASTSPLLMVPKPGRYIGKPRPKRRRRLKFNEHHDDHGRFATSDGEGVEKLKTGTVIGSRKAIDDWSKDSVLKDEYYHYSPKKETIETNGFRLGAESQYDGIYFAYDKELSRDLGGGLEPVTVRLNVSKNQLFDMSSPSEKNLKDEKDWGEEIGEAGTIGPFMQNYGYLVWDDGTQIAAMHPSVIGIIQEATKKGNPHHDAHGRFTSGDGESSRSARALASHVPITKARLAIAIEKEKAVALIIGGKTSGNNKPFDVVKGKHAVEVKTIISGKNPKITMHPESLARKKKEAEENGFTTSTVVIDNREKQPQFYFRDGLGSFRLSSMTKISSAELREKFKK